MGRAQVQRPVFGREFHGHLSQNPHSGTHSGNSASAISSGCEHSGTPVVQAPHKFSRTTPLRESQSLLQHSRHLTRQLRTENEDFGQRKGDPQLNRAQFHTTSVLQQVAQLFRIQPLISGPGEEELHFDLDPR